MSQIIIPNSQPDEIEDDELPQASQAVEQSQIEQSRRPKYTTTLAAENWPDIDFDDKRTMSNGLQRLSDSRLHLAHWVLERGKSGDGVNVFGATDGSVTLDRIMEILIFMNEDVLRSIIKGTIIRDVVHVPAMAKKLPAATRPTPIILGKNEERPVIYGHWWVSRDKGESPTKRQFQYILNLIRMYIDGIDVAYETLPQDRSFDSMPLLAFDSGRLARLKLIDTVEKTSTKYDMISQVTLPGANWKNDHWKKGRRRYIENSRQLQTAREWISVSLKKLNRVPAGRDNEHLPWAVSEIGWTISPKVRSDNHRKHTRSVPLMSLVSFFFFSFFSFFYAHFEGCLGDLIMRTTLATIPPITLGTTLTPQLDGHLGDHFDAHYEDDVGDHVDNHVDDHFADHLEDYLGAQLDDRIDDYLGGHLDAHHEVHVDTHIRDYLADHLTDYLTDYLADDLNDHLEDHLNAHPDTQSFYAHFDDSSNVN